MKKKLIIIGSIFTFVAIITTVVLLLVFSTDDYDPEHEAYYTYSYSGEEEITYLNDIYNVNSRVYAKVDNFTYGVDYYGDSITLYDDNETTSFNKGIGSWSYNGSYTIVNVAEYGYEYFESYVGATNEARKSGSAQSFEVRIVCDGVTVETASITDAYTTEFIKVDLEGVEVIQIFVDNLGSNGDHIGLGDPLFRKSSPSAYMDVFDLEFNQADQVTSSTILEYAECIDISGNDISSDIKYITNYIPGTTGQFDLTYYCFDNDGVMRSRDVSLIVTGQDYSDVWTIEDFKTPYVNYLYHARQTYSSQMKKFFDYIVKEGLDFNDSDWSKRYRSNIYTSQNYQSFNVKAEGIYLNTTDANNLLRGLWDCEPRIFMLLNLDLYASYYCGVDSTTGLMSSCGLWAQNLTTKEYDARIKQILDNSEWMLEYSKDDMTYAQSWKYVTELIILG